MFGEQKEFIENAIILFSLHTDRNLCFEILKRIKVYLFILIVSTWDFNAELCIG
jgi:hypothetical protein